jgi:hypothetical protein
MSKSKTIKSPNTENVRDQWRQLLTLIAERIARELMAEQQQCSPKTSTVKRNQKPRSSK